MSDITNLNLVLMQTKLVEKLQEGARRQSQVDQQQQTRVLADKVDIRGHQVDQTPESLAAKVDPEASGEQTGGEPPEQDGEEVAVTTDDGVAPDKDGDDEDGEGKGRIIDVKA